MNQPLTNPQVLSVRDVGRQTTPYQVYVGRPSKWGNPYVIGVDGTREEVLEKFRTYLEDHLDKDPYFLDGLRGKDLICWCSPERCHADILLEYANAPEV